MHPIVKLPSRRTQPQLRPVHQAVHELNMHALETAKRRHMLAAVVEAKRAIALQPNSKELWTNLATWFWSLREYDESMACIDRALKLDPTFYKAFHNKALVLESLGHYEEAERYFEMAITNCPENQRDLQVQWCRSMMRLSLGDYQRGWDEYETRIPFRKKADGSPSYPKFPAPLWQGENLTDKSIFVCIEQGIGDTIAFSRWLPWLKKQVGGRGKIYLCAEFTVVVLLWHFQTEGIVEFVLEMTPIPECDYSVWLGSLPFHAKTTLKTLPADPGLILKRAETQQRIGPASLPEPHGAKPWLKVGVCWTGNPEQERNDERTIPFKHIMELAVHPNVWLYGLQVGPAHMDIDKHGAHGLICDLGPQLKERGLSGTASAILQMDLVITCCTSVAHLAGALGKETWVCLTESPYWLWMHEREDSPWYPSVRLFRQKRVDDWKSLMQEVRDALSQRADELRESYFSQAETG